MERFCDELRFERERRHIPIETIGEMTKVSMRHLQALEAGNYGELPGGVFRKGIVRSYVSALGLEEVPWIQRFELSLRESGAAAENENWAEFAENVHKNRGGSHAGTDARWMGVALMVAAVILLAWCVWHYALQGRLAG